VAYGYSYAFYDADTYCHLYSDTLTDIHANTNLHAHNDAHVDVDAETAPFAYTDPIRCARRHRCSLSRAGRTGCSKQNGRLREGRAETGEEAGLIDQKRPV